MATDWLPGCIRQDWGTNGGSWTRLPAIIVVHSTEGTSWPGYDGGSSCPHFTINLATGERRQHVSMAYASRALANASGGVETNRGGAIQIEVIGTCDPAHKGDAGWLYLPTMSNAQAANLSRLMREIADARDIAWACGVTFKAYPGSYGSNGVRLSGSAWNSYRGILGHQHVPENDHGDPGNIDIATIMGGDDMPLNDDDIRQIWAWQTTNPLTGKEATMGDMVRWGYGEAAGIWTTPTTSPVDGAEVDTLTVLRWAYGEAHKAAQPEEAPPEGRGHHRASEGRFDATGWAAVAALILAIVCFVLIVT